MVNWKLPLALGLTQINEASISYQHAWANFCHGMRTLCPETNWIMMDHAENGLIDIQSLQNFHHWLTFEGGRACLHGSLCVPLRGLEESGP